MADNALETTKVCERHESRSSSCSPNDSKGKDFVQLMNEMIYHERAKDLELIETLKEGIVFLREDVINKQATIDNLLKQIDRLTLAVNCNCQRADAEEWKLNGTADITDLTQISDVSTTTIIEENVVEEINQVNGTYEVVNGVLDNSGEVLCNGHDNDSSDIEIVEMTCNGHGKDLSDVENVEMTCNGHDKDPSDVENFEMTCNGHDKDSSDADNVNMTSYKNGENGKTEDLSSLSSASSSEEKRSTIKRRPPRPNEVFV